MVSSWPEQYGVQGSVSSPNFTLDKERGDTVSSPSMTEADVRTKLLDATKGPLGVRRFAAKAHVSVQHVYRALRGDSLGPKILKALGLREIVSYQWEGPPVRTNGGSRKP